MLGVDRKLFNAPSGHSYPYFLPLSMNRNIFIYIEIFFIGIAYIQTYEVESSQNYECWETLESVQREGFAVG